MKKIIITENDLKELKRIAAGRSSTRRILSYMEGLFNQPSRIINEEFKLEKTKVKKKTLKVPLTDTAEKFRKDLIANQTPAEREFKALLKSCGVVYEFQMIFYHGEGFSIVDFYIPDKCVAFEIDGGYHDKPIQQHKDMIRTSSLVGTTSITNIIRIKNGVVFDTEACIKFIKDSLNIK